MSGGLDALENIGKKTMEVLTEGDPGFQNKRKLLKREAPSLSALLREAKAEAEAKQNEAETTSQQKGQAQQSYSSLFDEYQGVIHLEALELLSEEYAAKVRGCLPSLTGEEGDWVEGQMELLDQALTIREDGDGLAVLDDDGGKLGEVVELFSDVTPAVKVEKLVKISTFWREKLETMTVSCDDERDATGNTEGTEEGVSKEGGKGAEGGKEDEEEEMESEEKEESSEAENKDNANKLSKEVYTNGLRGLVQLTSASIEVFRKIAEVSLLPQATKADTIGQAKRFNRLTVLVSGELDALASVHAEVLTDLGLEDINTTITALYMEVS
ncbi:Protein FAM114A2 [Geodia barretti]|uniref:Protein FAM114A2 n=1 Tax=Geodia barretti TaxID=519541 RepID=A0AA35QUJ1_GEOBA|nr:Protein FAM114A2 [Geodia barretti]